MTTYRATSVPAVRPTWVVGRPPLAVRLAKRQLRLGPVLAFLLAHVPLALVMDRYWMVSTAHALVIIGAGLFFIAEDRSSVRVAQAAAYIVGAELLWRGTDALVFWETGKYAIVLLLGLALLKGGLLRLRDLRGLAYLALLIPSLVVLPYFDRSEVAFNLSGPASLAVAATFFATTRLSREQLVRMLLAFLGPVVGLSGLAAAGLANIQDPTALVIGGKATTAGIGPNQVSTVFGLGAFACFLLVFLLPRRSRLGWMFGALGLGLAAQTMLSLSRGGFWAALVAAGVAAFFLAGSRRVRGNLVGALTLGFLVFQFLLFPLVDSYTGGLVSHRYSSTRTTGRDKIIAADLEVLRENPILGVGPGQSYTQHARTFRASSAHTEFSRMLSEHGALGVLALLLLASMVWSRFRARRPPLAKACSMSFMAWALLTMAHSAMRLAAPGFFFGLGSALLLLEEDRSAAPSAAPPNGRAARGVPQRRGVTPLARRGRR